LKADAGSDPAVQRPVVACLEKAPIAREFGPCGDAQIRRVGAGEQHHETILRGPCFGCRDGFRAGPRRATDRDAVAGI
jgi:hypothetical protein